MKAVQLCHSTHIYDDDSVFNAGKTTLDYTPEFDRNQSIKQTLIAGYTEIQSFD